MIRHTLARLTLCGALIAGLASPALAGPPLVCFPFDIGTATSLPWNSSSGSFKGMRSDYDLDRLNRDTIALLTPSTPVLVRMETLRRAALYASANERTARALLDSLLARAKASTSSEASLAEFDLGYLIETYRQLGPFAPFAARHREGHRRVRHGEPQPRRATRRPGDRLRGCAHHVGPRRTTPITSAWRAPARAPTCCSRRTSSTSAAGSKQQAVSSRQ